MSDETVDPAPWLELRHHLQEAARLLRTLRQAHEPRLDFKHYSKLQFAETTVDKFVGDVELVAGALAVEG